MLWFVCNGNGSNNGSHAPSPAAAARNGAHGTPASAEKAPRGAEARARWEAARARNTEQMLAEQAASAPYIKEEEANNWIARQMSTALAQQGATEITAEQAPLQQSGPADAVAAVDTNGQEAQDKPLDESAALLQGGIDELEPLRLREALARNYALHEQVNAALLAAEERGDRTEADRLAHETLKALGAAVRTLRRLCHEDIRRQLDEFHKSVESATPSASITLRKKLEQFRC